MRHQVVANARSPDNGRDVCAYNIFRRRHDPELCCAVPEHRPVPIFIAPEEWEFAAKVADCACAPVGFQRDAARAGVRFNGFYLFQAR
jgi:hypothetical protein